MRKIQVDRQGKELNIICEYSDEWKSNWVRCPCGNFSEMAEICQGSLWDDDDFMYLFHVYKILKCPSCESISVIRLTAGGIEDKDEEMYRLHKEPISHEFEKEFLHTTYKKFDEGVPGPILEVYNQARAVIATSPRAAFILSGATLEEICHSHKIPTIKIEPSGKERLISLNQRLEELFNICGLPKELQDLLHGIRKLRNVGAHGSQEIFDDVSKTDAEMLLDLLDHVLDRLYINVVREKDAESKLRELSAKYPDHSAIFYREDPKQKYQARLCRSRQTVF